MKYSGYIVGAAMAAVANAHTTIWNMYENDVDLGVGNVAGGYIRFPPNNNPVKDITSADMTCNVANTANTLTKSVAAGSKLTLEWHHDTNSASDDIIASSHKGPVMVYIAPTSSNGAGDVWVKIAEDGYDASTKLWAVDTLIANKGKHSFTLPSVLADGDYLVRGEIIALHEADTAYNANSARGAQFYMECVQITVTGGGSTALSAGVAIPGAYTYADPGVVFNLYGSFTSYTIPGPAVWDAASGSASTPAATSAKASAVASSSAVVKASSSVVVVATSAAAPVASSAPAVSSAAAVETQEADLPAATTAPVASASKSACKAKTSSIATQAAVVTSAAPVASVSKSACVAKSSATTLQTVVRSSSAGAAATGAAGSVALYGQCGGNGYTGATTCASGTCTVQNAYYSQCV